MKKLYKKIELFWISTFGKRCPVCEGSGGIMVLGSPPLFPCPNKDCKNGRVFIEKEHYYDTEIQKFRKKPVVIEAMQYDGTYPSRLEIMLWGAEYNGGVGMGMTDEGFIIKTLEGEMKVEQWDFVIKGVQNEFYPCKPDIFEATYEKVEEK